MADRHSDQQMVLWTLSILAPIKLTMRLKRGEESRTRLLLYIPDVETDRSLRSGIPRSRQSYMESASVATKQTIVGRHKTATRRLVFRLCIIQETIPVRGEPLLFAAIQAQSPHSNQPPDPDLTMRLRPYTSGIRTGQPGTDCFVRGTLCARPSRVGW